jgi:NAD+ diphosphatase
MAAFYIWRTVPSGRCAMRYDSPVSVFDVLPDEPRAVFRCCPRCGIALTTPGACPLACAACGFAYYFNPAVSAAAILLRDDGQALFIRRGHEPGLGRLAFVGGFVDAGETPEVALRREADEEVGVALETIAYLGSQPNTYAYRGITYRVVDLIFVATLAPGAEPRQLDGVAAIEWHDPLALDPGRLAFASMTWALTTYQRQRR